LLLTLNIGYILTNQLPLIQNHSLVDATAYCFARSSGKFGES